MGRPALWSAHAPEQAASATDELAPELFDVPAAIVCASCGQPECSGCFDDHNQGSGVIAIVPWECPGPHLAARLVTTARLATTSSEAFFSGLPDGDTAPALRFAIVSELLAVSGLVLFLMPLLYLAAPWLFRALAYDMALRQAAFRAVVSGVPGVALAMVAVHAAHGLGLDWGARRQGASSERSRGLRFGLYACGWDLLTLPLAVLCVAFARGPGAALRTALLGLSVPDRAARAYLRGVHRLDDTRARGASRFALLTAGAVILFAAGGVLTITLLL